MRPGPSGFATDDLHNALGEFWNALETKIAPSPGEQATGWQPEDRPSAELLNYLLNRLTLAAQSQAAIQVRNWQEVNSQDPLFTGKIMETATQSFSGRNTYMSVFFYDASGNIQEAIGEDGFRVWSSPPSNPVATLVTGITEMDAAGDTNRGGVASGRRVLVANATAADQVFTTDLYTAGAWALATINAGGFHWSAVGCDQGTVVGATPAKWLIGSDGAGPVAPSVFDSVDGINFNVVAGFPVLTSGAPIRFIGHTRHREGSLGPNGIDLGNSYWLVLTDTQVAWSPDGVTWNMAAHGIAGGIGPRAAAYSRITRKWVIPRANDDSIFTSIDNGATWQLQSAALNPGPFGSVVRRIAGDGFGTFVISDGTTRLWFSVDDGASWGSMRASDVTIDLLEGGADSMLRWYEVGDYPTFYSGLHRSGTLFEAIRSLAY